nr:uncharacterized protein LOC123754035 isoform X2 [Procambarus clarkii]
MAPIQQTNTSSCHDTVESTSTRVHSGKPSDMHSHITSGRRQRELGVSQPGVSQPESAGVREALLLPITCRGHFYDDTFFSEARQHFDTAVRDVLDRLGQRSALDDDLTSYRRLRQSNLTEASQAVSVTEDDKHHQVVLDVRDFLSGDVKVKMIDENELVVEGSVEQRKEGSVSKKSFRRLFSFPGLVRPEAVTSTMSSDGVLTVTVPKKEHLPHTTQVDVNRTDRTANSSTVNGTQEQHLNKSVNHLHKKMSSESTRTTQLKEHKSNNSKLFNNNSEATKISTNSQTPTNTSATGRSSPDQTSDFLLPISHRGLFFHDSFFTEARQDFEAAVKRIVDSWEEAPASDHMTSYRRLRERDLKEENQAVSVTENHQSHKVVLDVRDFLSGDVKVKMVDENELVVEGSVEQRKEGSVSKKSFRRLFSFPGLVRPEAVTSTMSSDGVLTVTVPKKESLTRMQEVNVSKINNTVDSTRSTETKRAKVNNFTSSPHHGANSELSKESKPIEKKEYKPKKSVQFNADTNATTSTSNQTPTNTSTSGRSSPDQTSDFLLPISHRGLFFHDSFFTEAHQDFEAAVKRIVDSWEDAPASDHMTSYRRLRERDLKEENQAVSVTENHQSHKVVLDVRDFLSGDVKVKMVDENELVVEGSVEQRKEGSVSKKSFRRLFSFPGLVRPEAVTSTMSSDGVLTVTVPKKEHLPQSTQVDVNRTDNSSTVHGTQEQSVNKSVNHLHKKMSSESTRTTQLKEHKSNNSKLFNNNSEATKVSTNSQTPTNTSATGRSSPDQTSDFLLPISHRGLFFHDSFFTETHQDFEAAVKRIVDYWEEAPASDHMTSYRRLRERDLKEENQAVSVTENHQSHKVVLDVRDFLSGDVKVKMVDENELVVEGSVEQRKEGSVSKKRFRRLFSFPGLVRPEAVTSTMSSDGVLTVTVPKKVVIDVRDFMSGDVKVKAVGQDEVVVEGRVEKTEGNFQSTKNFSRRFNLPGMDLEAITSAVSSDGVLTIKASKSSRDARVKTTSQAERTFHHAGASENSSSSSSIQEESCHEKKEERAGLTSHTFTKTSSHQSYTSQM